MRFEPGAVEGAAEPGRGVEVEEKVVAVEGESPAGRVSRGGTDAYRPAAARSRRPAKPPSGARPQAGGVLHKPPLRPVPADLGELDEADGVAAAVDDDVAGVVVGAAEARLLTGEPGAELVEQFLELPESTARRRLARSGSRSPCRPSRAPSRARSRAAGSRSREAAGETWGSSSCRQSAKACSSRRNPLTSRSRNRWRRPGPELRAASSRVSSPTCSKKMMPADGSEPRTRGTGQFRSLSRASTRCSTASRSSARPRARPAKGWRLATTRRPPSRSSLQTPAASSVAVTLPRTG